VIIADPTAPDAPRNPSRFVDPERRLCAMPLAGCVPTELEEQRVALIGRDREETVRTAYVAATRARDLLVVPVNGDEERESWLEESESKEIDDGVALAHEAWRERRAATTASGSVPMFRLVAPTGGAGSAAAPETDVSPLVEVVADRDASRPRGKRFGTLLHAT